MPEDICYVYSEEKNAALQKERGIGFEEVIAALKKVKVMVKFEKKVNGKVLPNYELDEEYAEMLAAIENGEIELQSVSPEELERERKRTKLAADNYFAKKDKRVSFRICERDLNNLKAMATQEGIPYQTYLTSIIHKWTTGQISSNT